MYQFRDANGHKKIVVIHTKDGKLHVHAGKTKDNPFTYDSKTNRYWKIDDPRLNDPHLFGGCPE